MDFILARVLDAVVRPSAVILCCCVIGGLLTLGRRRAGRWLLFAGVGGLAALAVLPLSAWMLRPLEARFPVPHQAKVDGIIVLGGAIDIAASRERDAPILNAMAGRMTIFAMLARRYPRARLLFSGGSGDPFDQTHSEAQYARRLFEGLGLEGVRYESDSRNTRENALLSVGMAHPKAGDTWLLVTSAADLPRAVGSFRAAGWPVIGYPADYHAPRDGWGFCPGLVKGLALADWAAHEWIGLAVYRWRGWTPALFPEPQP